MGSNGTLTPSAYVSPSTKVAELDLDTLIARAAITDTITRFLRALDDANPTLLYSTLTADMIMDLTPLSRGDRTYTPFEGREVVVEKLMNAVGTSMDSAHHVSNFLIDVHDSRQQADVSAYALAQHFRSGEGPSLEHNDYCLMGNRYQITMAREDKLWKIKRFAVSSMWVEGDVSVLGAHH